ARRVEPLRRALQVDQNVCHQGSLCATSTCSKGTAPSAEPVLALHQLELLLILDLEARRAFFEVLEVASNLAIEVVVGLHVAAQDVLELAAEIVVGGEHLLDEARLHEH